MEDKTAICDVFGDCLRLTRAGDALSFISYEKIGEEEYADMHYKDSHVVRVCITADSGIAIMRDILRNM